MVKSPSLPFRLAQAGGLLAMALLGLVDLAAIYDGSGTPFALLRIPMAIAAAAVWLPRHHTGTKRLPYAAMALSLVSVLVTALTVVDSGSGSPTYGLAEAAALFGIVYVVARHGAPRPSIGAILLLGLALGLMPLRSETSETAVIVGLAQGLFATACIAAGVYVRLVVAGRQRALDGVRAEQRAEFARDLHDFIAHHVTGIVVQAQGARYVAAQNPEKAVEALERIEAAGAETMASMRRMVGVLRDPQASPDAPLAPLAGVDELGRLVEQFNDAGGVRAELHVDGETGGVPIEVSTSAYRIVMEALTNIRRHARDSRFCDVWVRVTPGWLLVRVANDGLPPAAAGPRDAPGYGLVGLQERVRTVGGRITAGPGLDGGWLVDAALPIEK
jgi:signal transduction histidine kinase